MPATPEELAVAHTIVSGILAPILIAAFLSAFLGGLVVSQAVTYVAKFRQDRWVFRVLVGVLTLGAIADTICECAWPYHYATKYFMDPTGLLAWPWNYTEYLFLTSTLVMFCQAFFIWRVWVVSGRTSYIMTALQIIVALAGDACCYYLGAWSRHQDNLGAFSEVVGVTYAWLSTWAAVDVLITGSMVYYLAFRPRRDGHSAVSQQSRLIRLVYLSFETNMVAMALQLITLGLVNYSLRVGNIWYTPAGFLEGKAYILCVLVTLNARNSSGSEGTTTAGGRSKGLGMPSGLFSRNTGSVQVTVTQDVDVDEPTPASYGNSGAASLAYALRMDSMRDDASDEAEKGSRGPP